MRQLGLGDEWLAATVGAETAPAVRFSSFFPYVGNTLLIIPPRSLWPPLESSKIRYKSARFVPLSVVESLFGDKALDEDRWTVDGESECLLPQDNARGPFRVVLRENAGVDRLDGGNIDAHATACLEFAHNAGLWTVVQFRDEDALSLWQERVRSALLLLSDSGFGGERSRGWGRSEAPIWQPWSAPQTGEESAENAYWLLSLYMPSPGDTVDWKRGNYATVSRSGRVESSAGWGEPKQQSLMIAEGSVVFAGSQPSGAARNVAPDGFPHPVYRSGFAIAIPIPWRVAA
jgi:CRISPR type III-A-associated RAMP protein Csm4